MVDLRKENGFTLRKKKEEKKPKTTTNRLYSAKTLTNADYADDLPLLANTPAQAESELQSLEPAEGSTELHANTNKTEYIYFKQEGATSTLSGWAL